MMLPRTWLSSLASRCSYILPSQLSQGGASVVLPHHRWRWLRHPAAGLIYRHQGKKQSFSSKTPSQNDEKITSLIADQIKSFSIGSVAGVLGSLAGMGGGFVMIPMMTAANATTTTSATAGRQSWTGMGGLGLNQHQAHGTSLFAVGTTGLAGALGYGIQLGGDIESEVAVVERIENNRDDAADATSVDGSISLTQSQRSTADIPPQQNQPHSPSQQPTATKGLVELDTAMALTATAMITARLGAIASSSLSERVLQRALGAFMICVAPLVTGKSYLEQWYAVRDEVDTGDIDHGLGNIDGTRKFSHNNNISEIQHQLERLLPASLIGMFSGFLSGMFGVGGGSIVVPSLVLTTNMPYHSALGTSLCAMVLPAMVGTFTHSKRGNVNWRIAPMLAMGSAVGAYFGGREIGLNIDEGVLRVGFSCLMLVLGVKTWRKGSR
ncbi:hypothetical protein ACHAXH_006199 [Discostella pseudostelligera]